MSSTLITSLYNRIVTNSSRRSKFAGVVAVVGIVTVIYKQRAGSGKRRSHSQQTVIRKDVASGKKRVAVNKEFFRNLWKLVKIVVPGVWCKESGLIAVHSVFLLLRTAASVYLATLDGRIVKALVTGNGREFSWNIIWWIVICLPIAFINSVIKYLQGMLSSSFRTRLTKYVHDKYMSEMTFYKLENLDSRIKNADQCITQDVAKFCNNLSELYSNLAKPIVDCLIYNAQLAHNVGLKGLLVLTACIHVGTYILRKFTPPFGRYIADEQRLEGNFRFAHSRVITNSEEIAFYGGDQIEKSLLDEAYTDLINHVNKIHTMRLGYGTLEDFVVKYYWGALGFLMCALPVFTPFGRPAGASSDTSLSSRTKDFVTNRRLLLNTSDAFARIMYSYKEVSELAGFTARVSEMLAVFDDMKNGRYQKSAEAQNGNPFMESKGKVVESDSISVDKLCIVSPNGDVLVKELSFDAPPGTHMLITGPNGCGKSSLFRILSGLWPVAEGTVRTPRLSTRQIFYIPQRPYLSTGSLRDQVIYPLTLRQIRAQGITDEHLEKILDIVKLRYIVEREGGWDARNEWKDVLSGGEKQRIAMSRLFFHKPRYAILDECTSAVSIDIEGVMYNAAKEMGISLMTVSHRPSLWKYHDWLLEFDGEGHCRFVPINAAAADDSNNTNKQSISQMTLEEEKTLLAKRIAEDERRLKKINYILGADDAGATKDTK